MIETTTLPQTDARTSRIGFGTSRLHHMSRRRDRQTILERAFDVGIRHFDTAPAYGHGLNERELGDFLRRHRHACTVATKYGIPAAAWIDRATAIVRGLALPSLALRALAKRAKLVDDRRPALSPDALERSVHASLRRLGVDRIDLHLLHEPSLSRCPDIDALIGKYLDLKQAGLIAAFGFAGSYAACRELLATTATPGLVLQTAESEWEPSLVPDITYGVFASGAQSFSSNVGIGDKAARERLQFALARRPAGLILVSTTRPARLQAIAEAAAAPHVQP